MTATFPFGAAASPRPPRRPKCSCELVVLGVYPSALHVRWEPPAWAADVAGVGRIGALAVSDEPVVFWDGLDADDRVEAWKKAVGFKPGDGVGAWGAAVASGNGTSGRPVVEEILKPLGIDPAATWFTDCVDTYFVKKGTKGSPGQADAMEQRYRPFAEAAGLPVASIPPRPSPKALVELAVNGHRDRLRAELLEARSPLIVTLGDEARQVLLAIADDAKGEPTEPLSGQRFAAGGDYGAAGIVRVDDHDASWYALVHPGQRGDEWRNRHTTWAEGRTTLPR